MSLFLFILVISSILGYFLSLILPNYYPADIWKKGKNENLRSGFYYFKGVSNYFHAENDLYEQKIAEHRKHFPRIYSDNLSSPLYQTPFPLIRADLEKQEAIKEAFLHAYNSYSKYCFGMDELNPLTQNCRNYINGGLTIIDSISTLIVMDLIDEYEKAKNFIINDFHPSGGYSLFEFIIRVFGGVLSASELTGDQLLTEKAIMIGNEVLKAIEKTGGKFKPQVYFQSQNNTVHIKGLERSWSCLAEMGTYQLELYTLAKLTQNPNCVTAAIHIYNEIWGGFINQGVFSNHFGAGEDSYYEYIIKGYVLTGGVSNELLTRHLLTMKELKEKFVFISNKNHFGHGTINSFSTFMEHLSTFVGGMCAVGAVKNNPKSREDLALACKFADTYAAIYNSSKSGIGGESVDFHADMQDEVRILNPSYILRPETVESIYVAWKFTGLQKYRNYAWKIFKAINKSCRVENGFASISNVDSEDPDKQNSMESFFLAETLKYLYLTFSDSRLISPAHWVFNTEAHPLRIWDKNTTDQFGSLLEFKECAQKRKYNVG